MKNLHSNPFQVLYNIKSKDRWYLLGILLLIAVYSLHLFRFTLFDGFATMSSDSASYVLLARKWSLFFIPSQAEVFTWPVLAYPPGLSWLLAISGASESLFLSHLLVSLCLLVAILLVSWIGYRKLGALQGIVLTINICLLPGIILQSMGILSENLYLLLSLVVLIVFSRVRGIAQPSWTLHLLFFASLFLAIMTRTIGIALLFSITCVTILDKHLETPKKLRILGIAILVVVLIVAWKFLDPQHGLKTYLDIIMPELSHPAGNSTNNHVGLLMVVNENLNRLPLAWNHYFSLTHDHVYFFIFSLTLLVLCAYSIFCRVAQLKVDAIYIVFYVLILLVWPYYIDARFLHPVIFLILLQPLLHVRKAQLSQTGKAIRLVLLTGLTVNSLIFQYELLRIYDWAENNEPQIAHSYELYNDLSSILNSPEGSVRNRGASLALGSAMTLQAMEQSASSVPKENRVATIKPAFYAIASNRVAVHMISRKSLGAQFCQLKLQEATHVFISNMADSYNPFGLELYNHYKPVLAKTHPIKNTQDSVEAVIADLDHRKIDSWLKQENFSCSF